MREEEMTARDQIIEAMVKTIQCHSLGESWGDDGVGFVGCDCGLWFGKAIDGAWAGAFSHLATAALDTALPLIQAALAERVRGMDLSAGEVASHLRTGGSMDWVNGYGAAVDEGARLIEGVEL